MAFLDVFVGSAQSKYAALAILVALLAVAFTILFSKEKVPVTEKIVIIFLMFLLSLPAILYALFQITCLVTGAGGPGMKGKTWWCGLYGWFITAFVFIYAVMVVVMSILSFTGQMEAQKVEQFYAQKDVYDAFAAEEMKKEGEADEADGAMLPAMPPVPVGPVANGDVVPSQPVVDEKAIVAPGAPEAVAPVPEKEVLPTGVVTPTIEAFSTCGAPFPAGF